MKKVSMKIALAVVMIAVGTLDLSAQNGRGRGTGTCGTCTGSCVNSSLLTVEQKAILENLCDLFQADMAVLRAELIAAPTLAEKLPIRQEMTAQRNAHIAEVKALLASWGINVSTGGKKGGSMKGTCNINRQG
ncbi:MAG: hypothetical protein WC699_12870 [Bacteroidales bacterium]